MTDRGDPGGDGNEGREDGPGCAPGWFGGWAMVGVVRP